MLKATMVLASAAMLQGCMWVQGDMTLITLAGDGCTVTRDAASNSDGSSDGQRIDAALAKAGVSSIKCTEPPE